jgi:hypothetical protein
MADIIYLGANEVEVVDRETNLHDLTYVIGKVVNPTFKDRPFLTICESVMDYSGQKIPHFHTGHYDMNLMDATNDFYRRLGYLQGDY